MAQKKDSDPSPEQQLLELLVYAPVGLALEAVDNFPKYVERGKSQVTIGRFLARTVARKGTSTVESVAEKFVNDASQIVVDLFGIDLSADDDGEPVRGGEPVRRGCSWTAACCSRRHLEAAGAWACTVW